MFQGDPGYADDWAAKAGDVRAVDVALSPLATPTERTRQGNLADCHKCEIRQTCNALVRAHQELPGDCGITLAGERVGVGGRSGPHVRAVLEILRAANGKPLQAREIADTLGFERIRVASVLSRLYFSRRAQRRWITFRGYQICEYWITPEDNGNADA